MSCPHLRGNPESTQWCGLAEREHESLERARDGYDRLLALSWELETFTDRLARVCPDPDLVAELAAWKTRRNT